MSAALDEIASAAHQILASLVDLRDEHPDEMTLLERKQAELKAQLDDLERQILAMHVWTPQAGDWSLVREVARWRGAVQEYWDQRRTEQWLADAGQITHAEMRTVLGPDWTHVVALVRRWVAATNDERQRYYSAVRSVWNSTEWKAAWRAVVGGSGPGGAALRALGAFVGFDYGAGVAAALARRSEVQAGDIAQVHYDVLARPWRTTFGPIHPLDSAVGS